MKWSPTVQVFQKERYALGLTLLVADHEGHRFIGVTVTVWTWDVLLGVAGCPHPGHWRGAGT